MNKPLNTVKIQLHRARTQLKQQLQRSTQRMIQQKDVKAMLNHLKEIALQYVSIPDSYTLSVEDIDEDRATFLWKGQDPDEGYYIQVSSTGKLLSLSQPIQPSDEIISDEQQHKFADQFLTAQYKEALHYFTLETVKTKDDSKRYYYKQLVHNIPLQSAYCIVEISNSGQLVNFEYKAYQTSPPKVPATFAATEPIVEQLKNAEWTTQLEYLSSDYYTVPHSGLYAVYHSTLLYHSFDAATGEDLSRSNDEETEKELQEKFIPLRQVEMDEPLATIEDIIGITPSMERIRQAEIDDGYIGIVWRDQAYKQPDDKSMNQFVLDRFEHCLEWDLRYETEEPVEMLIYRFKHRGLGLPLKYIDARTGELIFMKE